MIKNITEEKLQEIIDEIVIPNSNIGVHKMTGVYANDYEEIKKIYDKILSEGFEASGSYKVNYGIISHIAMCGMSNNYVSKQVMEWEFGNCIKEGIKIIFAIPSIIKINEKEYYIGEYPGISNDINYEDSESITYGKFAEIIPKEFILGHLKIKYGPGNERLMWTSSSDFILNNDYIGLKNQKEQQHFFESYEQELNKLFVLSFDEEGYEFARSMRDNCVIENKSDYYYRSFFKKYSELNNGKQK